MSQSTRQTIAQVTSRVVSVCVGHAWTTLLFAAAISVLAGVYLAGNLKINTDNEDMLSEDLQFRQNSIAMDDAFPQLDDTFVIVVEAANSDAADEATTGLAAALSLNSDVFEIVFTPVNDPFFGQNGLLYLDTEELNDLYDRLAGAQPFLGTLWQEPNLSGLASISQLISDASDLNHAHLTEAAKVYDELARVTSEIASGRNARIIWSELLFGNDGDGGIERRLISVKPRLDYGSLQPGKRARNTIHSTAEELGFEGQGINIRLTGGAIIQDDELKSVEKGMGLAGLISAVVVTLVLGFGLRSFGMMCALLITLVVGLVWTASIAIFWVGEFNLISVAFAVLFVGLSVDFGIHLSLRATEFNDDQGTWSRSLVLGAKSVGPSLVFCAITTSIAFFSFLPTAYVGLAELGLIAGIGMFVALVSNLTVLPALLRLMVRHPQGHSRKFHVGNSSGAGRRPSVLILSAAALSVLLSAWIAKDVRFDFDPMNLRDHDAPSMKTLFDMADADVLEPYSADLLLDNISDLAEMRRQLEALATVKSVESIDNLIPKNIDEKLAIIDDLSLLIGTAFYLPQGDVGLSNETPSRLASLLQSLGGIVDLPVVGPSAQKLRDALVDLSPAQVSTVNHALFGGLPFQLERLNELLGANEVTLDTLPAYLRDRYIAKDGKVRLEIKPVADLRSPEAIEKFALDIQSVSVDATGGPIIIVEAGRAVLDAFLQALFYSMAGIGLFLLITLRRIVDVVLVFVPVAIAGAWVLAVSAIFDLPFNFANVIVLPLLFGLSVDFGLHLVVRQRDEQSTESALRTTTPRAILLSAMTTLGSFGSIMLSGHPGTSSMGVLLTIAIALTMFAILLILPAMMKVLSPEGVSNS